MVTRIGQSTRYRLDVSAFESQEEQEVYLFSETSRRVLQPTQAHTQYVLEGSVPRRKAAVERDRLLTSI